MPSELLAGSAECRASTISTTPAYNRAAISIADVGFEGAVDYERLTGANPDLVMLYGVNGPNPMEGKLRELGIPYIYIGDYLEESPQAKAEWVVALRDNRATPEGRERIHRDTTKIQRPQGTR